MTLLASLQARVVSWWQDISLPAIEASDRPIFQSWHEFSDASNGWCPVQPITKPPKRQNITYPQESQPLRLVTWNVDSASPLARPRINAILTRILSISPAADIIFLQELSRAAIAHILEDPRLRQDWLLSDADDAISGGQSFKSMTLLSKARFQTPGPVWRVNFPSRYARDALCCDVFVPSPSSELTSRIRLINVHLDSLQIHPSLRPKQLSVATAYLQSAGQGVVAGDFNPVLPEDATLVEENDLVDAWSELRSGEDGFTWGVDGDQPFPPIRMDKVAVLGLKLQGIDVYHPETIKRGQEGDAGEEVPWSDHSGLSCTFGV